MRPGKEPATWLGRVWAAVSRALSTPPADSISRRDAPWIFCILVSFAVGLAASWQRWGNPLVDSGRELNVSLRLGRGEMLYSDVGYIYGPLSPYLNAFLYRIFHPSLWLLWARGIVSTILILALVYWLARQIMGRFPATLACLAVTWVCALKSQGNYVLPYAFSGLDGGALVLATTACSIIAWREKSLRCMVFSGVLAALAVLAKTEMGGTAIATGLVAATLAGYPRIRGILLRQCLFLIPAFGIPAAVFWKLASIVGWQTLVADSHLFFGHVPRQLMYFNGLRFGFGHPWHSLGLMAASLIQITSSGGLLASVVLLLMHGQADARKEQMQSERTPVRAAAILIVSIAGIVGTGIVLSDLGPFLCMPFLLLVLGVAGIAAFLRAQSGAAPAEQMQAGTIIILIASALVSLSRMVLRVSTGGALSSFLLPGSMLLFVYLWLAIFPLFLPESSARLRARQLASIVLCLAILATAVTLSVRYRRKFPYPLATSRGTWRTSPELGIAFEQAYEFIQAKTAPGDPVAILPEGTSLLFLSDRRNPLRDEIVTPGFLDEAGEERAIQDLGASKAAVILIANRTTPEFGEPAFGRDYNRRLMSWIEQNYGVCGVFGAHPDSNLQFGSRVFFIRGYCRIPDPAW